jgi:hypothetical protein
MAKYFILACDGGGFYSSPAYAAVKTWLQTNFPTG